MKEETASKGKLALYIRVSTKQQKLEIQKEQLLEYAKRKGKEYRTYIDYGFSGSTTDRPAFKRLMNDLDSGEFEAVVVKKLDRFGRSMQDLVNNVISLKDKNISFIVLDQNIDTTTKEGRLFFHNMASFAEYEREMIVDKMAEGRERALKMGKPCHRPRLDLPMEEIVKYHGKGLSDSAIAKIYNVSRCTIWSRLRERGLK